MDGGTYYIISPRNSHSPKDSTNSNEYNTITVESVNSQELIFTTPNVYTSYNKCLDIIYKYTNSDYTWADIRETLRDNVRHTRVREWAIKIVDLAEQQLRSGKASSQVITHYLKLGSTKEKMEREMMKEQTKLLKAKTENLQTLKNMENLYSQVLDVMKNYRRTSDE
jgi:hypothetical protein